MSYVITFEVRCDAKGCTRIGKVEKTSMVTLPGPGKMARMLRTLSWFIGGGTLDGDPTVAYCPDHRYLGRADA